MSPTGNVASRLHELYEITHLPVIGVGGRALAWPGPTQARLRPGPGPAQVKRKGSPKLELDLCFKWISRKYRLLRCLDLSFSGDVWKKQAPPGSTEVWNISYTSVDFGGEGFFHTSPGKLALGSLKRGHFREFRLKRSSIFDLLPIGADEL